MKLTDQHREFLRANARTDTLLYDFMIAFMHQFNLTPEQAGKLIGAWLREVY